MIRVRIHINETEIIDIHAVRENVFRGMTRTHQYEVFITWAIKPYGIEHVVKNGIRKSDNKHESIGFINHKYSLGASRLSVRMLQMYNKHKDGR